jgi:ATP-binding cassette, subfamily B, bacterial
MQKNNIKSSTQLNLEQNSEPYSNSLTKFFIIIIAEQKWKFIFLTIAMFAWTIQEAIYPLFFKLIIEQVTSFTGPQSQIFNDALPVLLGFIGLWLLVEIGFRTHDFLAAFTYPNFKNSIREKMFSYAMLHSHNYFAENFAGTISSKITRMADAMERMMEQIISLFIPLILAFIVSAGLLYSAKPIFGIGLIVWFSLHMFITLYFTRNAEKLSEDASSTNTKLNGKIVDAFSNIINIRVFSRFNFEQKNLTEYQIEVKNKTKALMFYNAKMRALLGFASNLFQFGMVVGGVYAFSQSYISLGDFVLILSIVPLFGLAWYLGFNVIEFFGHVGTCREALSLITKPHDVVDKPNSAELIVTKGEIFFDNVTFNYIAQKNIFSDRSIKIIAGQKVGLVGFSGSGKSTFVNLILRYFDVNSGCILIDNIDIKTVTQASLRQNIAIIPQDTSLFHRSLMENIRYGNPQATDEQVMRAAKQAQCHDFIMQTPENYNALVGERGVKLSGGQRQRIAIARAILKDAPILILDEATSALDSITEQAIQKTMLGLMQNKTTIVVAHRLSTLLNMDRILVFDDGKIIEDGSHQQLLQAQGHYAKLWQMQANGFLDEKTL